MDLICEREKGRFEYDGRGEIGVAVRHFTEGEESFRLEALDASYLVDTK